MRRAKRFQETIKFFEGLRTTPFAPHPPTILIPVSVSPVAGKARVTRDNIRIVYVHVFVCRIPSSSKFISATWRRVWQVSRTKPTRHRPLDYRSIKLFGALAHTAVFSAISQNGLLMFKRSGGEVVGTA